MYFLLSRFSISRHQRDPPLPKLLFWLRAQSTRQSYGYGCANLTASATTTAFCARSNKEEEAEGGLFTIPLSPTLVDVPSSLLPPEISTVSTLGVRNPSTPPALAHRRAPPPGLVLHRGCGVRSRCTLLWQNKEGVLALNSRVGVADVRCLIRGGVE